MVFFPFSDEFGPDVICACLQELVDDPFLKDDELGVSEMHVSEQVFDKLVEIFDLPHKFRIVSINECRGSRLPDLVQHILEHTPVETLFLDRCDSNLSSLLPSLTAGISANDTLRELRITSEHRYDSSFHEEEFRSFLHSLATAAPYLEVLELNSFDVTTTELQQGLATVLFPTEQEQERFLAADKARIEAVEAERSAQEAVRIAREKAQMVAYLAMQQEQDALVQAQAQGKNEEACDVESTEGDRVVDSRAKGDGDVTMDSDGSDSSPMEIDTSGKVCVPKDVTPKENETLSSLDELLKSSVAKKQKMADSDDMSVVSESHAKLEDSAVQASTNAKEKDDEEDKKPAAREPNSTVVRYRAPMPWKRIFIANTRENTSYCTPSSLLMRLSGNIQSTRLNWLSLNGHKFTIDDMALLADVLSRSNVQRLSMRHSDIPIESWVPFFGRVHEMKNLERADFGNYPKSTFTIDIWRTLQQALIGGESHEPCTSLGYIGMLPRLPQFREYDDDEEEDVDEEDRERERCETQEKLALYQDVFGRLDMNRLGCTRSQTTMSSDEWASVLSRLVNNLDHGFFFLRRDPSMWSHGAVVLQQDVAPA